LAKNLRDKINIYSVRKAYKQDKKRMCYFGVSEINYICSIKFMKLRIDNKK